MQGNTFNHCAQSSNKQAFTGNVYMNPGDFKTISTSQSALITIKGFVVKAEPSDQVPSGSIAINKFQREEMFKLSKTESFPIKLSNVSSNNPLAQVRIKVTPSHIKAHPDLKYTDDRILVMPEDVLAAQIKNIFKGKCINKYEKFVFSGFDGNVMLTCVVEGFTPIENKKITETYGVLGDHDVDIILSSFDTRAFRIESDRIEKKEIFKADMNFQDLGIGGLDEQFSLIFRRAFNSRTYPQHVLDKFGIKHTKGILLYGPPGTGKTLIARKISEALNCEKPLIVNGPELNSKYVGEAEKNMRALFEPAEKEQEQKGDESGLHVIIFDEFDAVCRTRSSGGGEGSQSQVNLVNQLLSKLDGVKPLNNILVIAMTNRKDMIDPAALRAGRIELHIEIGLPDFTGRLQVFQIKTKNQRDNNLLADDVSLEELSEMTKNYTGAEIESVCKIAASFVLNNMTMGKVEEQPAQKNGANSASMPSGVQSKLKVEKDKGKLSRQKFELGQVTRAHYLQAIEEVPPIFGKDTDKLELKVNSGFHLYGNTFNGLWQKLQDFSKEFKSSDNTALLSLLFEGETRSGKTALAAKLALESKYPFVKIISPEILLTQNEYEKIRTIVNIFEDAYKSELSLIILDDIERLIEYIHIGPRFSNHILQNLLTLIRRTPKNKLMIIGTTSNKHVLDSLDLADCFNVCMNVPNVRSQQDFYNLLKNYPIEDDVAQKISEELADLHSSEGVPIKNIILAIELSQGKNDAKRIEYESFTESLGMIQMM